MTDIGRHLRDAVARLELLRERNDQQQAALAAAAGKMADQATAFADGQQAAVLRGDPQASAEVRHALGERYLARQLVGGAA